MADAPAHPAHPAKGGTISIAGHKVKKSTALVGGAAAVGVILIAVYRRQQAAAGASPAAAAMVTDPAGNQCSALNAATGYCPGTAADAAAQQATAAGLSSASGGGLAGGGGSYYIPPATGTSGVSGTGSAVPSFTDNASWGQYVETALGSNGSDSVAAAIAKYLSGQPVTPQQQTLIEEAIAIGNYPPVTGPNGDPPSMTLTSTSTTPTTGTTSTPVDTSSSGTGSTSTSTGAPKPAAPTVSAGHMISHTNTGFVVGWTGTGATQWHVMLTGPGPENGRTAIVGTNKATYSGLPSGHSFTVTVVPWVGGKAVGAGGKIDATTTK